MAENQPQSGMSKKASIAVTALTGLAAIDCENPVVKITAIAAVGVVAICVQGFLDYLKAKNVAK